MYETLKKLAREEGIVKDFHQFFSHVDICFLKSYAEERLPSTEYIQFKKKLSGKLAIRKILNPFSTIKFLLMTSLGFLSFLLKTWSVTLGAIPFFVIKLLLSPLAPTFPKIHRFTIASLSLFGLIPLFLLHTLIHSLQLIVEHLFSPVNNFIRPIFWNFFMLKSTNPFLSMGISLSLMSFTGITCLLLLVLPVGLPFSSITLIGLGLGVLTLPTLSLTFKILQQIFKDFKCTLISASLLAENYLAFYEAMPHLNFEVDEAAQRIQKNTTKISDEEMTEVLFKSDKNCTLVYGREGFLALPQAPLLGMKKIVKTLSEQSGISLLIPNNQKSATLCSLAITLSVASKLKNVLLFATKFYF